MAATLNQAARLSTARNPQPRTEDRLPIRADAEHRRERNRTSAAGPALHSSSRPSRARRHHEPSRLMGYRAVSVTSP